MAEEPSSPSPVAEEPSSPPSGSEPERTREDVISSEIIAKIGKMVTAALKLPKLGDDYELCNSFNVFTAFMQQQEIRMHSLIAKCMETSGCPVRAPKPGSSMADYMDRIRRASDAIAERAGICLDAIERSHRNEDVQVPESIIGAESTKAASVRQMRLPNSSLSTPLPAVSSLFKSIHQHKEEMHLSSATGQVVVPPQREYGILPDNSHQLFVSKLRVKHHTREPARGIRIVDEEGSGRLGLGGDAEERELEHPYRVELEHFQPEESRLESKETIEFKPLADVTLTIVNKKEGLERLRDVLNQEAEFAVDLEHNDSRTFLGLTCLLQISTRSTDYIVDVFPVWHEMHILNEPFANPAILKVFHGADSDIQWLQRDFGIHVVNMFDTYHAMKRLELPKFSLQFLVQKYCAVTLSKQYQTSDWRLRPLTEEQMQYARCDTHYLLYCYDRCREELLEKGNEFKNLLRAVYSDSVVVCGKAYVKPVFDPLGYENLMHSKRTFNSQQIYALKELWRWRDRVARSEDEGIHYVLPNHMMMYIAEALPREAQGIAACCNPVPETVKRHVLEIHKIVYTARDQPLVLGFAQKKNILGEEGSFLRSLMDDQNRMTKLKSILRCNMDFSHSHFDEEIGKMALEEANETEVTLKQFKDSFFSFMDPTTKSSKLAANEQQSDFGAKKEILAELEQWATPYERYSIGVKKAAEAEARKMEENSPSAEQTGGKKRYSHHDPANARPKHAQNVNVNVDNIQLEEVGSRGAFTDDQILTKRGLARKRKQARKAADIKLGGKGDAEEGEVDSEDEPTVYAKEEVVEEEEEETPSKKKPKVEPVDYSQYDKNMFSQKPSKAGTFDPFHQQHRLEKKTRGGRGRGRGGFHRMGKQSTGFKPQDKKK